MRSSTHPLRANTSSARRMPGLPGRADVRNVLRPQGSDAETMARAAAFLYGSGGLLVLASIAFGQTAQTFLPGILAVAAIALMTSAILYVGRERIPWPVFPPLVLLGTTLITALIVFDGASFSPYALIYVWAALFAFYFFRPLHAAMQAGFIAIAAAFGLLHKGSDQQVGHWLLIVGTVLAAGALIQWLTSRIRSDEEALLRLNADLERRVEDRTAELEATNRELEAFSYTVSHDLRAPLRAIDGFSQILVTDHADELSEESRHQLHQVASSAQHMGQLIDSLLDFSRLAQTPLARVPVDPAAVARQSLEPFAVELAERHVEVIVDVVPPANADPVLLRQVYANLLGNAIKFSSKRVQPMVHVGARPLEGDSGEPVYYVRDNGIGFDTRYAEKMFGVFQKLHRPGEYDGNGAGLAIVQRIVHRHGGRVWADSTPGEGATFYFTLGG